MMAGTSQHGAVAQLLPRSEIARMLRHANPGSRTLFPWPEGVEIPPSDRETFRRRVHSCGYALFGPGRYSCATSDAGVALTRAQEGSGRA